MPEVAALPAPDSRPRRKRGGQPFEPTPELRRLIAALATFGISQQAMTELLRRDGVPCVHVRTLARAFREELKIGRELMISALGTRMYDIAMSNHPSAFGATAFLLRTFGGPAWRVADNKDEAPPPPDNAGAMIFPRADLMRTGGDPPAATIEATAEPIAESSDAIEEKPEGWQTLTIKRRST
jgi:hypothetical protein